MWDNFVVTFNIIAPLVLYMLLGGFLRRAGIMDEAFTKKINKLLMVLFIPCNTFSSLCRADFSAMGDLFYVFYAVAGNLLIMLVMIGLCKLGKFEPARLGSFVQGACRGNGVIFGIPLCESIFGAGNTASMALMLAFTVPFYNIAYVALLEICGQKQAALNAPGSDARRKGLDWKAVGKGLLKNGIIWGVALGLAANLLHLPLPSSLTTCVSGIGSCVTPLAFIMVGASFRFSAVSGNRRDLILATLSKLVFIPLVFLALPVLQGWTSEKMLAMLVAFAAPTAIISFPMAKDAGCDGELASEIVASTTIFSMLSMFLWIFCFKQAGLL